MSLQLERWAKQAVLLEPKGHHEPVASSRVLADINDLAALHRQEWLYRSRMMRDEPTALEGIYAGLNNLPPSGVIPNVTSISGEVAVWDPTKWSTVLANSVQAPEAFRIAASYTLTTSTSPANGQWYPKLGTTVSGAALSAIPAAQALTASIVTNYYMKGDLTFRLVGAPGAANGTAIAICQLIGIVAAAGVGTPTVHQLTGHTSATWTPDAASGFCWTAVHTVATITYQVQQVHWASWN